MARVEVRLVAEEERVQPVAKFLRGGDCQVNRVIAVSHMNEAKADVPLGATDEVAELDDDIEENGTLAASLSALGVKAAKRS